MVEVAVIFGILIILGSFVMFVIDPSQYMTTLIDLVFGICFISLGMRNIIYPQEYTIWLMTQIYNQVEKNELVLNIEELKKEILKIIFNKQKHGNNINAEFLEELISEKNISSLRCLNMLIDPGMIEKRKGNYHIPESELDNIEDIIKKLYVLGVRKLKLYSDSSNYDTLSN